MKVLFTGDNNYGDRDRETDVLYKAISLLLRTNAVRNGDDLVILYDPDTYLGSAVETILDTMEGDIQVTPHAAEIEILDVDSELDTKLVRGETGKAFDLLEQLDADVDLIGFFTADIHKSDNKKLLKKALAEGIGVTVTDSYYNGVVIPGELYPEPIMQQNPDGSLSEWKPPKLADPRRK